MAVSKKYNGIITTFYSYKGGVGRSMALANIACLAAKESSEPILLIDWDLEAPGLHEYFREHLPSSFEEKEGLLEFCTAAQRELPAMPLDEENPELLEKFYGRLGHYLLQSETLPNVFLLKAGRFDSTYSARVAAFDWGAFFQAIPAFFPFWAKQLRKKFAHVFIDSRTGHGDAPGISTMLMPEKLVLVFTPNRQSLRGVLELAKKAIDYRVHSDDYRPLQIYPLPSRVELGEDSLRRQWQRDYTQQFEETLREAYGLTDSLTLKDYFERVQIPHFPRFAYGEELAVLEEGASTRDINSLANRYLIFKQYLFSGQNLWTSNGAASGEPLKVVFVSQWDDADKAFSHALIAHLAPLVGQGTIHLWQLLGENRVNPAKSYWDNLQLELSEADLALIVVSIDLLSNSVFWKLDFPLMLERQELGELEILPVIFRECLWEETPLAKFQALPRNGRAIQSQDPAEMDKALYEIASAVRDFANKPRKVLA